MTEKKPKALIELYFGEIKNTVKVPKLSIIHTPLKENILIKRKENVQLDRLYMSWHSDRAFGEYDASLDILGDILTGSKNARLYKTLVYHREEAQDVSAYQYSGKYAGHFLMAATAKPGIRLENLKKDILEEFENIRINGVSERELTRSINGIKSSFIYSMQNVDSLADQLNFYNFYLGEPNSFNADLTRYEAVTNESIKEAIEKFLLNNYVELHISPNMQD